MDAADGAEDEANAAAALAAAAAALDEVDDRYTEPGERLGLKLLYVYPSETLVGCVHAL